jgi:hypothetical protein
MFSTMVFILRNCLRFVLRQFNGESVPCLDCYQLFHHDVQFCDAPLHDGQFGSDDGPAWIFTLQGEQCIAE